MVNEIAPIDAICESKALLSEEIRGVLEPDQQTIWDEWVADLPDLCSERSTS